MAVEDHGYSKPYQCERLAPAPLMPKAEVLGAEHVKY